MTYIIATDRQVGSEVYRAAQAQASDPRVWTTKDKIVKVVWLPECSPYASEFSVRQSAWQAVSGLKRGDTCCVVCDRLDLAYNLVKFCLDAGVEVVTPVYQAKKVTSLDPKGGIVETTVKHFVRLAPVGGIDE